MSQPRIILTAGEPAGIGPELVCKLVQQAWPAKLSVVADPDLLQNTAKQINLSLPEHLSIIPVPLASPTTPGQLNPANATYVIKTLEVAAALAQQQHVDAIVTGPVHKGIINQADIPFSGHTEFFAQYCNVPKTVMLFVIEPDASLTTAPLLSLKVALATVHLPLKQVAAHITQDNLRSTLTILQTGLQQYFHFTTPRIAVCGLNPHAGENGYLGQEEIEIITPLLVELRQQGYQLIGPLPADTAFTPHALQQADVVLAMYHDQALPVVKCLGFGHAVNMTLGLPFLRTSVDHGTALDIAGKNKADVGSFAAALRLAINVATPPLLND
ncbi:MAG TPA: 4-hydroxythreonine-4-phosphate dehydrogenase PdxA [Gammaproteobacteria bacterium]|jgi:4-hydroxythreonine-4-phosphate dehydrogenase|nr:4-hydroxythreonine-4-phosphate dehydrogenase PdxA [Gammaproteobacteria bacterium]